MKIRIILSLTGLFIWGMSCQTASDDKNRTTEFDRPPTWAEEAIWYQIFVERFHNADPENDPTLETTYRALYDNMPSDWHITPWSHNWYQQEEWTQTTGLDFYRTIQMRRYGGDLKGVMAKIPYLKDLGINAIYFNPLNDAPSLHKYDARSYHHIDVTFGPDPIGDMKIIASEDPADPDTWKWTSADKLFLELVDSLHASGIRVILDFSWNHTGNTFWAFRDIQENLNESPYKDWYEGEVTTDKNTGEYVFNYQGWHGIKSLPEWRKIDTEGKIPGHPYEGNLHPGVKQHIYDVCRRWIDPYGNGDVHKGIDGMRLDVAEHVPMGFWRDFRKFVRSINPEFYLVGENWWTEWPHQLMDASPWVKGDVFDAVMHYQWYKVARGFFGKTEDRVHADRFGFLMDSVFGKLPKHTQMAMMNLSASHDTPRLLTCMFNKGLYKHYCKPQENPVYLTQKPDRNTFHQVKLLLLHQFTFIGSPHIWNGDELGMWGADDPDNRKPLWWPEKSFDNETASAFSDYTYNEPVKADIELLNYYKSLIALRKNNPSLIRGDYTFLDTGNDLIAYTRALSRDTLLIVLNNEEKELSIETQKNWEAIYTYQTTTDNINSSRIIMPPNSGIVLKMK